MTDQTFSPLWLCVLAPIGFVIYFVLLWLFVVWLIGAFGWRGLAQRYRTQQRPAGKQWIGQYGFVNRARYGNALNVTTNDAGLFIEPVAIFRFNHPSLFIPWQELHNPQPLVFRQRDLVQVDVGHPPVGTLRLPPAIFEQSEGCKAFIM
jgi:hypothetical protein